MNARVLVTGATTPLGLRFVKDLAEDPKVEHVLAVGANPRWIGAASRKITYVPADLTRTRRVRRLVLALVQAVDDGHRAHEDLAGRERADEADPDLPIEAQRLEHRFDRLAQLTAVARAQLGA